jgi:hypothetical protein
VKYDPEVAPPATQWLEADDDERLLAIRRYHKRAGENLGEGAEAHCVIHNTIENQLAEGHPAATSALERLMAEGLDRHDAIHAIGSILAAEIFDLLKRKTPFDPDRYDRKLGELTASRWRSEAEEDE